MKTRRYSIAPIFLALALAVGFANSAFAASKNKLDARVRDLTDYFAGVQKEVEKAVPAEILSKAEGMVVMRNYKAGFIIGVSGGAGVAILKDKATGKWGPVGFVKAGEGSFGFQAGAQRSDLILILMNSGGTKILTEPNLKIGADVRATVGPKSGGDQANLKTDDTPILVYGDTKGLYGGASLETGGVFPDDGDNAEYYGKKVTMSEVLSGKVKATEASEQFAAKIEQFAKPAAKK